MSLRFPIIILQEYACAAMETLVACLSYFVAYFRRPAAQKNSAIEKRMLTCTNAWLTVSSRVWISLWDVKTPFLDSQPELSAADFAISENLKLTFMHVAMIDNIYFDEFQCAAPFVFFWHE